MQAPTGKQRAAAWIALICMGLLVLLALILLLAQPTSLVLVPLGLLLIAGGGWWLVTERSWRAGIGGALLLVGIATWVFSIFLRFQSASWRMAVVALLLVLVAIAAGQARVAVAEGLHIEGSPFHPPKHPVLLANPKSGGGKFEKFGLKERAEKHGVEVIVLEPGDDLEQLARDAVARGADCLGMAGGDGSQALVASVAAEHDLPFVCISAGTRNHFAMDLGLDRDDPGEGIIAFREGLERRIDYATVSDRLFVNNVSLGVYATIVQQDAYRDAKMETSLDLLPELLGQSSEPFDLQFVGADGAPVDGAFVILVSNNPYVMGPRPDMSKRRSLTTGKLGVFAVDARTGKEAAAMVTRFTLGLAGRDPHIHEFDVQEFTVDSHSGAANVGVDGEAMELPTPIVFRSHPGGLRVRVPKAAQDRLKRRRARGVSVSDLFRVAKGRPIPDRGMADE